MSHCVFSGFTIMGLNVPANAASTSLSLPVSRCARCILSLKYQMRSHVTHENWSICFYQTVWPQSVQTMRVKVKVIIEATSCD